MRVELTFPSAHMFLGIPDAVVQELGSELPFSQAELDELSTSIIEACTNAIEHGNGLDPQVPARLVLEFDEGRLTATVYDRGVGFTPPEGDPADNPPDLLQERGRGLFMMDSFCDEIRFFREGDEFACQLVKLPRGEEERPAATGG